MFLCVDIRDCDEKQDCHPTGMKESCRHYCSGVEAGDVGEDYQARMHTVVS